jgi:uncharacterized repeat protein (TIGR03803 family)
MNRFNLLSQNAGSETTTLTSNSTLGTQLPKKETKMKRFNVLSQVVLLLVCFATAALPAYAQFVQGANGNYYGPGNTLGIYGEGTIVSTNSSGWPETTIYNFCSIQGNYGCADGAMPIAPLLQWGNPNANFYGATGYGGANEGTLYQITPSGTLTTLYTFCLGGGDCTDGAEPSSGLILGTDGNFYGTTCKGGANTYDGGYGTLYRLTPPPGRTHTVVFSSDGQGNGTCPTGSLTLGSDGYLHGTTAYGGANSDGTAFAISYSGNLESTQSFGGGGSNNGSGPTGGIQQGNNGTFWGTTSVGGEYNLGTVFRLNASGEIRTVLSFEGTNGATPEAGLILATDGNFYGTASAGGKYSQGTAFKIAPTGKLETLKSFDGTDGATPIAGLMQGTDGDLLGTTSKGWTDGYGRTFKLSLGLRPFVESVPNFGQVGAAVMILGTNLKGATSVSFNGTEADFTVVSASEITTTVPVGAATGEVEVITPKGKLKSNMAFQVSQNSGLPFCSGSSCLYYAGDFDSNDSNANALFNANDEADGLDGQAWVGVIPTQNATVTGGTFNEFLTTGAVGTNPTPFAVNTGMSVGNAGTTVCNTSGNATATVYGESDFGLIQYSYTIAQLSESCPFTQGTTYYVNLLPAYTTSAYGYVANVEDNPAPNHQGWANDLDDCFFNGAAFDADYTTCNTQGTFDELSIALTGSTDKNVFHKAATAMMSRTSQVQAERSDRQPRSRVTSRARVSPTLR